MKRMYKRLLSILNIPSLTASVFVASSIASCAQSCTGFPAVLWDVDIQAEQTGWNGLFDPDHQYGFYTAHVASAYTVEEDNTFYGNSSEAIVVLTAGPGELDSLQTLTCDWQGTFIIEDINGSLKWQAWVRGLPGTKFNYNIRYGAQWDGILQSSGAATYSGAGTSGPVPSKPIVLSVVGTGTTTTETTTFSDITYSRAQFQFPAESSPTTSDILGIHTSIAESCILFCDESIANGELTGVARIQIYLPQGVLPVAAFTANRPSGGLRPMTVGDPITLTSFSYDPDHSTTPGDGIAAAMWRDGTNVFAVVTNAVYTWIPTNSGTHTISLEAFDDNGMASEVQTNIDVVDTPTLRVQQISNGSIGLYWPTNSPYYEVISSDSVTADSWTPLTNAPSQVGTEFEVVLPNPVPTQFYRLRSQ